MDEDKNEQTNNLEEVPFLNSTSNDFDMDKFSDHPAETATSANKNFFDYLKLHFRNNLPLAVGLITVLALIAGFFIFREKGPQLPVRQFSQVYSLVNEKMSKNAPVIINLPEGVSKISAQTGISFDPEIKGKWADAENMSQLVFIPNKELRVGEYYAVNLDTPAIKMRADFFVDENPQIDAIFPNSGTEAHENSNITIIFNRPMVPLTTLDELDRGDIPIEITPNTEGKFKWISTRNLQFIPEERLQRSSNYKVQIKDGFYSMDNLPVKGTEHAFITRPLRYVDIKSGQTLYSQPIILVFNQPVDLEKTSKEITVTDSTTKKRVPLTVEYGVRTIYNREKGENEEFIDRSILNIYQKNDRHGRKNLWDFKANYELAVNAAYPLEGDIALRQERKAKIQVPDIIESISAGSERSNYVRPDLFDAEGSLIVRFFEDVDLRKSGIKAKGLKDIQYGEKCRTDDEGHIIYLGSEGCEKEEDKKTFVLAFDSGKFGKAEDISIEFQKIYNIDGLKINADPIVTTITTYPAFQVYRTIPPTGGQNASLTELVICSNTPIKPKSKEDYREALATDGYLVFSRWQNSIYVETMSSYHKCQTGEFETRIRYGLLPETDYSINVNLEDDFGQKTSNTVAFRSTLPDQRYVRFHNLQKVYNVTQPGKTKLTYAAENIEYVNFHICKIGPEALLENLTNRPAYTEPPDSSLCESIRTGTIQLPKRYWVNNYFQIKLQDYFSDTMGHYIISLSHPDYRETYGSNKQIYDRAYVSVTNLAVVEKRVEWDEGYAYYRYGNNSDGRDFDGALTKPGQNLYWVSRIGSLLPAVGATVSLYSQDDNKSPIYFATSYKTDILGIARGEVVKDVRGAVVRYLNDSAIISEWADYLQRAGRAEDAGKTYIYTDRPIYRPGQEVFIRGIDRVGYDGTYEVFTERNPILKITDSRGNVVYEQAVPISEYGTFDASFMIPQDAPLGIYIISAFGASYWFSVEEYVPAAFKLDITSEKDEYVAGDVMKLNVNADYFFGVPVEGGEVTYSVTSQDYYFDKYKDEYFNFGGGWYFCYSCGYGDNFLFRGKAILDKDGKAGIEELIDFSRFYKDAEDEGSKIFVVNVTAKDANGRSVSAQKSFIIHRGEFYLGVKSSKNFLPKNTKFTLRAKSVDTDGSAVSKGDIEIEINKIIWKTFKRREVDGGFYYRSEKEEQSIEKKTIRTDRKGNWSEEFSLQGEGQYEVTLFARDSHDNPVSASTRIYIYGDEQVSVAPTNNYTLEIETERLDVSAGDQPQIIIKSPYEKAKALITAERGKIFDYWIVDVDRNLYDFTIPIKKEYSPNVYVSAALLSPDPEIKFGQVMFNVDRSQYELNVDVTSDKTRYLPGETVNLTVKTTNYKNQPVSAEVSLAVADLSVLALKGNPKKNPLIFFYDGFPLTVTTASNIKNILYEIDIPLGTKGGGGGGDPADLARKKRGVFKDTAFWEAKVKTNPNGTATVSFTLPDNLTTWQIESIGITKDTLVGVDYGEITARKDLMAVPLKPRFIVPGDEFYIGAKIFNQTNAKQKISTTIQSDTLELMDDTERSVTLGNNETDTVYFKVKAPQSIQNGIHNFTLSAKSSHIYEDTVENSIPITRNDTYETVATANFTKENSAKEYIYIPDSVILDKGGLTINANATMAVFLSDALNYLVSYPYGCSEQLASKLSSIGTIKRGLALENVGDKFTLDDVAFEGESYSLEEVVARGLGRIYENQAQNGGFAYYKSLKPDFYLTLHVIQALENLREAGFAVSESSLDRAAEYAYNAITTNAKLNKSASLVILTAYTLNEVDSFSPKYKDQLKSKIEDIARRDELINEEISSLSLAYLAIVTADGYSENIRNSVFGALENKINIDGRGAYLTDNKKKSLWEFYETPIKNTAILLKAVVAHKNEHPLSDKIIRWLLRSRSKDGAWGSTNNTLATIDAMVDFLKWQRETESDFTLTGNLDGKEIFDFDFNKNTILETFTNFVPIGDLAVNKIQTLSFERTNRNDLKNNFYYDMSLKYYLPINQIPPRDEGITISRELYKLADENEKYPVTETQVGDVLKGKLIIIIPKSYNFISVEDFIPAGFELVNFELETEDKSLRQNLGGDIKDGGGFGELYGISDRNPGPLKKILLSVKNVFSKKDTNNTQLAQSGGGLRGGSNAGAIYLDEVKPVLSFYPDFKEMHDDRLFLFKERINPGVYEYEYFIRALVPGTFHHLPAVVSEMYFPEVFGRTSGSYFTVTQ